jgi:hypothetical protein
MSATYPLSSVIRALESPAFLPCCFAAFVLLRLGLILFVPVAPYSDALWYFARGREIADRWEFSENGTPTAYWPIGYPGFLGLLFAATGPSIFAAQLANLALAAATFPLMYLISRQMLDDELTARVSVLLLTIYPNSIGYVPLLLAETLYTALLLLASFLILRRRGRAHMVATALVLGLATLVKTQTILLVALMAGFAILLAGTFQERMKALLRGAALIAIALAVVFPWTLRNYLTFNTLVFVSTNGGMSLLLGNNPSMKGVWSRQYVDDDPLVKEARFSVADQVNADRRARTLAYQWIRENPVDFISLMPQKFWNLWARDGEAEWMFQAGTPWYETHSSRFRAVRYANQAFYAVVMLLAAAAFVALIRRRASGWAFYGYFVAAFFTALSLAFSGQSRYHFPVMPFMLIYASWFLAGFWWGKGAFPTATVGRSA